MFKKTMVAAIVLIAALHGAAEPRNWNKLQQQQVSNEMLKELNFQSGGQAP